jgi:hypothetical protein
MENEVQNNYPYWNLPSPSPYREELTGYHLTDIPKGKIGQLSKVFEEYCEVADAEKQNCKIMVGVELADLIGAIELYAKNYGYTLDDLVKMKEITHRAFLNGRR